MRRMLQSIGAWIESRAGLKAAIMPSLTHPIPKGAAGPMGWWYVFGSASLTMLVIQIVQHATPSPVEKSGRALATQPAASWRR